jgi:hypothetical protein
MSEGVLFLFVVQILPQCHNLLFIRRFEYACVYSTLRKLGEANGEFSGVTRLSKYSKQALGSLIEGSAPTVSVGKSGKSDGGRLPLWVRDPS